MSDPKVPDYWTIVHEDETVILKTELDRLRAENAELREALFDLIEVADGKAGMPWKPIDKARAILAKTAKERE